MPRLRSQCGGEVTIGSTVLTPKMNGFWKDMNIWWCLYRFDYAYSDLISIICIPRTTSGSTSPPVEEDLYILNEQDAPALNNGELHAHSATSRLHVIHRSSFPSHSCCLKSSPATVHDTSSIVNQSKTVNNSVFPTTKPHAKDGVYAPVRLNVRVHCIQQCSDGNQLHTLYHPVYSTIFMTS